MSTDISATTPPAPAVTGIPLRFLRSEGLVLLVAALAAYVTGLDEPWWLVPLLLFVPDVVMVGYACSNRLGALLYNAGHSYAAPALLGAAALAADAALWQGVALVWFAHIGMDRALVHGHAPRPHRQEVTGVHVEVRAYDTTWPAMFEAERVGLTEALAPWLSDGVHHIGSTSVPGPARPRPRRRVRRPEARPRRPAP